MPGARVGCKALVGALVQLRGVNASLRMVVEYESFRRSFRAFSFGPFLKSVPFSKKLRVLGVRVKLGTPPPKSRYESGLPWVSFQALKGAIFIRK